MMSKGTYSEGAWGIVLLPGQGAWWTRLSWECLEVIIPNLAGRGWVKIGSEYETSEDDGTPDAYLKLCVNARQHLGWPQYWSKRVSSRPIAHRPHG